MDWIARIPWEALGIGIAFLVAVITMSAFVRIMLITRSRRKKREALGDFLQKGRMLFYECEIEWEPPPEKETDEWTNRAEDYLVKQLGRDYLVSFRNSVGIDLGMTSITSGLHRNLQRRLKTGIIRLEQFLEELRR